MMKKDALLPAVAARAADDGGNKAHGHFLIRDQAAGCKEFAEAI